MGCNPGGPLDGFAMGRQRNEPQIGWHVLICLLKKNGFPSDLLGG